jgi:hypothetical protein
MVIGRIVAQVERPEAGTESPNSEVELVGDAVVDVPHRHLEAVTAVTDLHVGREMIGDVDRHLERQLGDETVDRDRLGRRIRLTHQKVVVELRRTGEVSLEPERRARREDRERGRQHENRRKQGRSFHCASPPSCSECGVATSGPDPALRARMANTDNE